MISIRYRKRAHSCVFCQIREGMLEAIELHRRERNRIPRDLCRGRPVSQPGPSSYLETAYIPVGRQDQAGVNYRNGREIFVLGDDLSRLLNGGQLVLETAGGERIILIKSVRKEEVPHERPETHP